MKQDKGNATVGVLATILVIVLVVAIGVGGYLGGWWLKEDGVNRNARINQQSYNRQEAIFDAVVDDYAEVSNPNLPAAQVRAITVTICSNAAKLTGSIELPFTIQTFIQEECS